MPNFSGLWTERQQLQATGASTWPAVPGAPTIGTATAGAGSAFVAFTAPSYTGYPAGITSYTVTSNPGGVTATGASSPITVSGLTNGTAYTFTVTATNATGTGPASAASNSVTPTVNYIEDVFSTYLYTGAGAAQTITNNIDLSTKGGLVWVKNRGTGATDHQLVDTARGAYMKIASDITNGQANTAPDGISAFNTNGFSIGGNYAPYNTSGSTYVSWTFRKQPKFFDIVTYTGDGATYRQIAHSLGSAPGAIFIKRLDGLKDWECWHRSLADATYLQLNSTTAAVSQQMFGNGSTQTSTYFTTGTVVDDAVNGSGYTYVAYLFAHNAGGFGLTGTDNVISCGSYTGNGSVSGPSVTLGYEPQWVMIKETTATNNWTIVDNMRPCLNQSTGNYLVPNLSNAEATVSAQTVVPTATGFNIGIDSTYLNASGQTYIYIAIRRGPMKVPTDATTVFKPVAATKGTDPALITAGFPVDLSMESQRLVSSGTPVTFIDRLRGGTQALISSSTAAERSDAASSFASNTQFSDGWLSSTQSSVWWLTRRAPNFFDEVCYTGTGSATSFSHNLGAIPEMMIMRTRSNSTDWVVYHSALGNTGGLFLDLTSGNVASSAWWNSTSPTSTQFTVGTAPGTNNSAWTFVAYLFATCAGVSKVGNYTGTGATQTINCGFTGGARFVLIKRTDTTSNWYVWDTARGMVAGTDPSLQYNANSAESNANSVYTIATGFQLLASPSADVNTSGGTYIYLAIA